jgi:hypothetical protein
MKMTPREERRRWCIEQAIHWPQVGSSNMMGGGTGYSDADIVSRAVQLEAYLTAKPDKD